MKNVIGGTSVWTTEKNYGKADLESLRIEIDKVTLQKKIVPLKSVSDILPPMGGIEKDNLNQ